MGQKLGEGVLFTNRYSSKSYWSSRISECQRMHLTAKVSETNLPHPTKTKQNRTEQNKLHKVSECFRVIIKDLKFLGKTSA